MDFSSTSLGEDELRLAVWIHHVTGDAQSGAAAAPWSDWQDETNDGNIEKTMETMENMEKNDGNYWKIWTIYGKLWKNCGKSQFLW